MRRTSRKIRKTHLRHSRPNRIAYRVSLPQSATFEGACFRASLLCWKYIIACAIQRLGFSAVKLP